MQELGLTISLVVLIVAVSLNAYNYMKESKFLKQKYKDKGYLEGYSQGFIDGVEFIDDIIPPKRGRRKK